MGIELQTTHLRLSPLHSVSVGGGKGFGGETERSSCESARVSVSEREWA